MSNYIELDDDIDCPYKDVCISYPYKCRYCKHNKARKDYFEPVDTGPWFIPRIRRWRKWFI